MNDWIEYFIKTCNLSLILVTVSKRVKHKTLILLSFQSNCTMIPVFERTNPLEKKIGMVEGAIELGIPSSGLLLF